MLVAVTARGDDACRGLLRDAGFDLQLIKPADLHQLLPVVDELFRAWDAAARTPERAARPAGG